jgi:hypothetical protein
MFSFGWVEKEPSLKKTKKSPLPGGVKKSQRSPPILPNRGGRESHFNFNLYTLPPRGRRQGEEEYFNLFTPSLFQKGSGEKITF